MRLVVPATALTLALGASPVLAADLPRPRPLPPLAAPASPPVAPPPVAAPVVAAPLAASLLAGPYIGLGLGYQDQNVHQSENGPGAWPAAVGPRYSDDYSRSSVYGSVFGGYNRMYGAMMVGLEGDVSVSPGDASHTGPGGVSSTFRSRWDGSVRLRLGYNLNERTMVYGTGGLAIADGRLRLDGGSSSNTHFGWTVGAGVDYAFSERFFGRFEVRYTDYNSQTYRTPHGPVALDFNTTRVGIGIGLRF